MPLPVPAPLPPNGTVPSFLGILIPPKGKIIVIYAGIEIASTGHCNIHAPHSMHLSLTTALLFLISIASTAHTLVHAPQPTHFSSFIFTAITFSGLKNYLFN
jgi:hypothetical protein